jgi:hypothetical protein
MLDKLLLASASVVLAGLRCWSVCHAVWQIRKWPKVPAKLVRYWIIRSDGQRHFRAVLRFTTIDGRVMMTISPHGHWRKRWPIGTVLNVRYHPQKPRWAEVCCLVDIWGLPLVLFALALWSALFAVFFPSDLP